MKPLDDKTLTLIENAQKGKDAFEQLVRRYRHDVFRIIRVYTRNDSDAEDLSQETWIKVYQSLGNLKKLDRFENWLFTIAVNTAKNWLKSRAYKESQATDEIQPQQLWGSAVIQYQRQRLIEEIRDAIDSLSEKNREVVLDFYILGYSAAQISQQLNIPQSTVTGRLQEARKQLRKEFETMVAQSAIREKFAPDSLVRNVMDRVASLPTSAPTGNIIQRIGRIFPQSTLLTIGIAILVTFTVISLIIRNLQSNLEIRMKKNDWGARASRNQVNMPIPPMNAPAQAPKQAQIIFNSNRDGNFEIYAMNTSGNNLRRLTNNPAQDLSPSWSPDGQKIVFTSYRDWNGEVYAMDADGSNQQNLTNNPANDWCPSWSPDGDRIAFASYRNGKGEVYVMDVNGNNQQNLTNNPSSDTQPSWSPDGHKIVFDAHRDGKHEVYVMDVDGNNQRNLTNNPAEDSSPDWFDPAFARSVSPTGKLKTIWGWLKLNSK